MTQTALRIATEADAPRLLKLLHAAYSELPSGVLFTVTRAGVDLVRQRIRQHTTFVIEQAGGNGPDRQADLLGTVSIRFPWVPDEAPRAPYPFIHWFAVSPAHKQQGLGRRLLDHAELNFLRDTVKAPAVHLATAIKHPWLTQLYLSRGYEPFGNSTNALGTELVWLRKALLPDLYPTLLPHRPPAPASASSSISADPAQVDARSLHPSETASLAA